jgi:hypothetical protein
MANERQFVYAIGDRVAERPKMNGLFAVTQEAKQRIAKYRAQRYGTIVGMTTRVNKRGQRHKFFLVQWDNLKSPSEHARMRICPIHELETLVNNVVVPGE